MRDPRLTMPRRPSPLARLPPRRHPPLPAPPRKALGQHFLHDDWVLDRIVSEGGFHPGETVLEVGGGTGELTERLAAVAGRLISVELDEALCRHLRARMAPYPACTVVCADVLDHAPAALLAEGGAAPPYVVAGNIPYYITAPILRHFLTAQPRPYRMVLLMQREVAERIAAGPGRMSLLGVSVQLYGTVQVLFRVPAAAFTPPPKVESAVVRIDVRPQPVIALANEERFFEVVRAGFRNPRKQLHNSLAQGLWLPPGTAPALLDVAGIDPLRRAQTLSLEEWERLARAFDAFKRSLDAHRARR
jgi:16S rRNA (adenine1518-N6/adenine1519-N6)-dimethyltransferase